jgi:hypothetical protein
MPPGKMVGSETLVAIQAFDEWIRERLDMAGGFPSTGVEDDGRIQANYVLA